MKLKSLLPWWMKIFAKIILSRIPIDYGFWQRIGLFRHGYMDQESYGLDVFKEHVARTGLERELQGKTLLELGPGDSVFTALIAACYGAKTILIDAGPFAKRDIVEYQKFADSLERAGMSPPDISKVDTLDDVLMACDAKYLTRGVESFSDITAGTVDLIFSQAVLEHIRKHEFLTTMHEYNRKPLGFAGGL